MASSQVVRGVRWALVLAVLAGFVALLAQRDGPNGFGPAGRFPGSADPLSGPGPRGGQQVPGPPPDAGRRTTADAVALPDEDPPPAEAVVGSPLVLRLVERNTDEFEEDLGSESGGDDRDAVVLDGGTAWIHPEVARSTDASTLARFRVRLGDPSVPLARCGVILVHEILYAGRGREGARVEVHGVPTLPASIPLEAVATDATLTFDPATERGPFAAAAMRLRVLPAQARLELAARGVDGIRATIAGTSRDIDKGAVVVVSSMTRSVTVTEKALRIDAVDLGPVRRESVPDEIFPEVRHGAVAFHTELSLHVIGRVRSVALEGPRDVELR